MNFCLKLFLFFTWPGDVPQFLVEPTSSIVQQGTSISLSCTAEPVGVKIKWLINGSAVTSQWHHGVDIGDGYLRIASFSKPDNISHEGTYQCLATTLSRTIVSREAKLEMAGKVEIAPGSRCLFWIQITSTAYDRKYSLELMGKKSIGFYLSDSIHFR